MSKQQGDSLPVLSTAHATVMFANSLYDSGKITGALPARLQGKGEAYMHRLAHGLRLLVNNIKEQGKRVEIDPESLRFAIMKAVTSGVDPSGNFSGGWFLLYKDKVVFQLGYGGLRDVVLETGVVTAIDAELVYKNEPFSIQRRGMNQEVVHDLLPEVRQSDNNIIGAYAVCLLTNGTELVEYAPRTEIDKAKQNTPAWRNWYGQQAKKFALKRLCNARVPFKGKDADKMAEILEDEHRLDSGNIIDIEVSDAPAETTAGVGGLKKRIAAEQKQHETEAVEAVVDEPGDDDEGHGECCECGGAIQDGGVTREDGLVMCSACAALEGE